MLRLVRMYLNSIILTERIVSPVGIQILASTKQCSDESVYLNIDKKLKNIDHKRWVYGIQYVTSTFLTQSINQSNLAVYHRKTRLIFVMNISNRIILYAS